MYRSARIFVQTSISILNIVYNPLWYQIKGNYNTKGVPLGYILSDGMPLFNSAFHLFYNRAPSWELDISLAKEKSFDESSG